MTLSRQLYLLLGALLLLVFIGSFAISLNNTRAYLNLQLASTAQDTATSLGLSVSTQLAKQDQATLQSMVDAVFDRGDYRIIRVQDTAGRTLYERLAPLVIDRVPDWFVRGFPLETPTAEAQVMRGWSQIGTLQVASHPGYAYQQLWRDASGTLAWFLACTLVGFAVGGGLLRLLLKPLRAVEKQALAIARRQYPVQEKLPRTRELRRVVHAMNHLSRRVGHLFRAQAALIERLQHDNYIDPVTGLGNRRQFDQQLDHLLRSPDEFAGGSLLLLAWRDFKAYNDEHGYAAGDALLRRTAEVLGATCGPVARLLCRLGGADFAVLVNETGRPAVTELAQRILHGLRPATEHGAAPGRHLADIGLTLCHPGEPAGIILGRADQALRAAQQGGADAFAWAHEAAPMAPQGSAGAQAWRQRIQRYLVEHALCITLQPVADTRQAGGWLHHEVLLRARETDGSLVPAGAFLFMAERTGVSQALDRRVVELAADWLASAQPPVPGRIAINLNPAAIADAHFVDWLTGFVAARNIAGQLVFELPERGVTRHPRQVRDFAGKLAKVGSALAVDHVLGLSSFNDLRPLKPAYVKLDGSHTRSLPDDPDSGLLIQALAGLAHAMGARLIAEAVETAEQERQLKALNVDGLQGYWIGEPRLP